MSRRTVVTAHTPLVPGTYDTERAGVSVRIKGERGTYTVKAEVRTDAGAEWTELWGGAAGHAQHRAVRPERVLWPKQPRRGGAAS